MKHAGRTPVTGVRFIVAGRHDAFIAGAASEEIMQMEGKRKGCHRGGRHHELAVPPPLSAVFYSYYDLVMYRIDAQYALKIAGMDNQNAELRYRRRLKSIMHTPPGRTLRASGHFTLCDFMFIISPAILVAHTLQNRTCACNKSSACSNETLFSFFAETTLLQLSCYTNRSTAQLAKMSADHSIGRTHSGFFYANHFTKQPFLFLL